MMTLPKRTEDLTGRRYGRLVVEHYAGRGKGNMIMWMCMCDCGNEVSVRSNNLRHGTTKSCGCLHKEVIKKHGLCKSRIYRIWTRMKDRCNNPKHTHHRLYYDRGIKICAEWENSFENFYEWAMKHGYQNDLTLDRIDNDGNYEPANCRWATRLQQQNNTRANHRITYKNKTQTLSEWARELGMNVSTLETRLIRGWSVESAIERPVAKKGKNEKWKEWITNES